MDRARGLALVDTYVRVHTVYIHSLHGNYYIYIYVYTSRLEALEAREFTFPLCFDNFIVRTPAILVLRDETSQETSSEYLEVRTLTLERKKSTPPEVVNSR